MESFFEPNDRESHAKPHGPLNRRPQTARRKAGVPLLATATASATTVPRLRAPPVPRALLSLDLSQAPRRDHELVNPDAILGPRRALS